MAHIINEALGLNEKEKVRPDELEKYNSSFVTNQLNNREADIVYKLKQRNIFFLIEHQSKPDYSMPYRIEEYKLEIIKSAIDIKKVKTEGYEIPEVIPIVIYTGKEKWKVRLYLNQIQDERFRRVNLLKYSLVDIHEYTEEKLLKSNHFIDKIFLIEKTTDVIKLVKILREIISQMTDEEDKKNLMIIMSRALKEKIGKEKLKELLKEMEGENKDMLAVVEMIREENRMIRDAGIKEGRRVGRREGRKAGIKAGREEGRIEERKEIISNMLRNGMKEEEIIKITGITRKELEQVKKKIEK